METVRYETYPPMFKDYDRYIENENYDDEQMEFEVPKAWAANWVRSTYNQSLEEFDESYTWDETDLMYVAALRQGVLLCDMIAER